MILSSSCAIPGAGRSSLNHPCPRPVRAASASHLPPCGLNESIVGRCRSAGRSASLLPRRAHPAPTQQADEQGYEPALNHPGGVSATLPRHAAFRAPPSLQRGGAPSRWRPSRCRRRRAATGGSRAPPPSSATSRSARARSLADRGLRSTMRLPYTLPSRAKAAVVSVLSVSLVAVPALSRVDPASTSGPTSSAITTARHAEARADCRSPGRCGATPPRFRERGPARTA